MDKSKFLKVVSEMLREHQETVNRLRHKNDGQSAIECYSNSVKVTVLSHLLNELGFDTTCSVVINTDQIKSIEIKERISTEEPTIISLKTFDEEKSEDIPTISLY